MDRVGLFKHFSSPRITMKLSPKPKNKQSSGAQARPKIGPGWTGLGLARPNNKHTLAPLSELVGFERLSLGPKEEFVPLSDDALTGRIHPEA